MNQRAFSCFGIKNKIKKGPKLVKIQHQNRNGNFFQGVKTEVPLMVGQKILPQLETSKQNLVPILLNAEEMFWK